MEVDIHTPMEIDVGHLRRPTRVNEQVGKSRLARGTQGVTQGKKKGRNGVEVFLADASNEAGPRGSWTRERMGKTGTSEKEEID